MTKADFIMTNAGLLFRAGAQAASLLIITRIFGVSDYGAISVLVALTTMLSPISGLGMDTVLVRRVVSDRSSFRLIWGQALVTAALSSVIFASLVLLIFIAVLPGVVSSIVILMVAIADLLFGRWLDCCSRALLAHDRGAVAAWVPSGASLTRLIGLLVLLFLGKDVNLVDWALVYSLGAILPAVITVLWCSEKFGWPLFFFKDWCVAVRQGLVFALDQSAERGRTDADKVLLANIRGAEAAGWYALAFRFVSLAAIPISAFLFLTYNRFFKEGHLGTAAVLSYTFARMFEFIVPIILLAIILSLASSAIVGLFGAGYTQSGEILTYLAMLLPILLIRQLFANGLIGAGLERFRLGGGIFVLAINVLLNILLIKEFGWGGAVVTAIVSETLLASFYILILTKIGRKRFRNEC